MDIKWSSNSNKAMKGGFPCSLENLNEVTGLMVMWGNINPVAQHNSTIANRQHQHTVEDDLLIQHSLQY